MGLALKILVPIIKLIEWLVSLVLNWRKDGKVGKITSPITDKLLEISATDLARKIRDKEISSEEVCAAYVRRIKEVNPLLNAIVEERFADALQDARNVDAYLKISPLGSEELEKIKPLLGVPLTVKESCSVAGMSLCGGTLGRVGIKAETDGETVSKLRSRGAIPLLVSNTPEICLSWEARNFVTGVTNNPYDFSKTPGGSSGGEGALLGAGASLIGIGSDVAGSVRVPALFNGIFGHKPSPRVVSIKGHFPYCMDDAYPDFLVIGPMARYAKDLKLMMKVMSCNDKNNLNLDKKVDLKSLRVFSLHQLPGSPLFCDVQPEIKEAIEKSVHHLVDECGSARIDRSFSELEDCCEISGSKLFTLNDIPYLLKEDNLALELCKSFVGHSKYTFNLLVFYIVSAIFNNIISNPKYLEAHTTLKHTMIDILGDKGVLLMPTLPNSAFAHNFSSPSISSVAYVMIGNTLGLPATHVPCGFDKNGLPIGIQVIAAPNQDRLCLSVAEELEKRFGGWIPPYHT